MKKLSPSNFLTSQVFGSKGAPVFRNNCSYSAGRLAVATQQTFSHVRQPGRLESARLLAETLLQMQMFPSLAARETYFAEVNFASWEQGNVSESS